MRRQHDAQADRLLDLEFHDTRHFQDLLNAVLAERRPSVSPTNEMQERLRGQVIDRRLPPKCRGAEIEPWRSAGDGFIAQARGYLTILPRGIFHFGVKSVVRPMARNAARQHADFSLIEA